MNINYRSKNVLPRAAFFIFNNQIVENALIVFTLFRGGGGAGD
jgi:hypothetical protein